MSKKMKTMNIQYMSLVSRARQLKKQKNDINMEIADLAMKACTIRHGGKSGNFYTMSEFCEDSGLSRKSVSRYIQIRKIQIAKEKNRGQKISEEDARKIRNVLEKLPTGKGDSQSKYENIAKIEQAEKRSGEGMTLLIEQNKKRIYKIANFLNQYDLSKINHTEAVSIKSALIKCADKIKV